MRVQKLIAINRFVLVFFRGTKGDKLRDGQLVTRYEVISNRLVKSFLSEKIIFCQLLLAIKVNLVDKMMQSNYFCVILHVKPKKC